MCFFGCFLSEIVPSISEAFIRGGGGGIYNEEYPNREYIVIRMHFVIPQCILSLNKNKGSELTAHDRRQAARDTTTNTRVVYDNSYLVCKKYRVDRTSTGHDRSLKDTQR